MAAFQVVALVLGAPLLIWYLSSAEEGRINIYMHFSGADNFFNTFKYMYLGLYTPATSCLFSGWADYMGYPFFRCAGSVS